MHRMKNRISDALSRYKVDDWQDKLLRHRWKYAMHIVQNSKMKWSYELSRWIPGRDASAVCQPHRLRGRPALRWDDQLHDFCGEHLGLHHWTDMERFNRQQLLGFEDQFVVYCNDCRVSVHLEVGVPNFSFPFGRMLLCALSPSCGSAAPCPLQALIQPALNPIGNLT